jgi:hypothetical protein
MSNRRKLKETRMRVELVTKQDDGTPHWVDIRTDLKVKDRLAVQEAAKVEVGADTNSTSFLAMANDMRNALLGRIIIGWSLPFPIPSQNSFAAADVALGDMDLDDYSALEEAVQPLMEKIAGRRETDPKKQPAD